MSHPCDTPVPLTFQVVLRVVRPRSQWVGWVLGRLVLGSPLASEGQQEGFSKPHLPSLQLPYIFAALGDSDLSSISLLSLILQLHG